MADSISWASDAGDYLGLVGADFFASDGTPAALLGVQRGVFSDLDRSRRSITSLWRSRIRT